MASRLTIGDIFEIPLTSGRVGFAQYVHKDNQMGFLFQVFDHFADNTGQLSIESVVESLPLFPPIFTGIQAGIKLGLWKVIGNCPVRNFSYPGFISTITTPDTLTATIWYL